MTFYSASHLQVPAELRNSGTRNSKLETYEALTAPRNLHHRFYRPGRVRDRHSRAAVLRRRHAIWSDAARSGPAVRLLLGDAIDLLTGAGPPVRQAWATAGPSDQPVGHKSRFLRHGICDDAVDAVSRKNHRRHFRRKYFNRASLHRRRHDAGKPREGNGIDRRGFRSGVRVWSGDRRHNEPLGCTCAVYVRRRTRFR